MGTIYDYADKIIKGVETFTNQDVKLLTRKREVVDARHVAMYIIKNNTVLTYKQIADLFQLKNHTTIISACNNVTDLLQVNKNYRNQYSQLIKSFER